MIRTIISFTFILKHPHKVENKFQILALIVTMTKTSQEIKYSYHQILQSNPLQSSVDRIMTPGTRPLERGAPEKVVALVVFVALAALVVVALVAAAVAPLAKSKQCP